MKMIQILLLVFLVCATSAFSQYPPEFDVQNYDRILVPVWAYEQIPGAANSLWVTELWARNESDSDIWFTQDMPVCLSCNPNETFRVRARGTRIYGQNEFHSFRSILGIFLHVEKGRRKDLFLSLRVRDLSRFPTSYGTELPIVGEEDGFTGQLVLPGIPVQPGFRSALRIFALNPAPERAVRLQIFPTHGNSPIVDQVVDLKPDSRDLNIPVGFASSL